MVDTTVAWFPDPQAYAVVQERMRHDQALHAYGEYVVFCLLWRIRDYHNGLVDRCSRCFLSQGKIAETYGQASQEKCPDCFGTSFEGGFKALIVRPVIWNYTEDVEAQAKRGVTIRATAKFQTTSDFDFFNDDYLFRFDNIRWQLLQDNPDYLVTGFQAQSGSRNIVGQLGTATREDESSVAYMIPPAAATLVSALDRTNFHYPLDFSAVEVIRGPLK